MYGKLFARITESSLMEESIEARYVFMMLLAIADPQGYVIGTDVAIARRMHVDLETFRAALGVLRTPDPDSNSKEQEGRRVVPSDGERGWLVVNYEKYRSLRDEAQRRDYMRDYMRRYRSQEKARSGHSGPQELASVNSVNVGKPPLAQAEVEADESASAAPTRSTSSAARAHEPCTRCPTEGDDVGFDREAGKPCSCKRGRARAARFARAAADDEKKKPVEPRGRDGRSFKEIVEGFAKEKDGAK